MDKVLKIGVVVVFAFLFLFLVFRNITNVSDEVRELPSEEELNEFTSINSKSDVNTYEVKDISDEQLATIYYTDFKNEVVNNPTEVYQNIRNKDEITEDVFNNFRNELINNYYASKVTSYNINGSTYKIINNNNQTIIFYVDTGFKYELEFSL
mgnify:FL=1